MNETFLMMKSRLDELNRELSLCYESSESASREVLKRLNSINALVTLIPENPKGFEDDKESLCRVLDMISDIKRYIESLKDYPFVLESYYKSIILKYVLFMKECFGKLYDAIMFISSEISNHSDCLGFLMWVRDTYIPLYASLIEIAN